MGKSLKIEIGKPSENGYRQIIYRWIINGYFNRGRPFCFHRRDWNKNWDVFQRIVNYKTHSMFPFYCIWLMVSTPLKNMSSSVGMIIPNIWKVIKNSMVPVTTNQALIKYHFQRLILRFFGHQFQAMKSHRSSRRRETLVI